ncbi:hypothetical protein CANCADRAFT_31900 [Tortispora caseinolytica NRRL Y-17796]|uniref:PCI domain-containing protein n=1 Tax=Tortispora caseinolytica NRRL Y-17796 TaxID=767744 RepID=A0A1E4THI4_9ASCO|nr:hypothetical protein CANCADRAFT_31900 [Tortispora caseinolytica NRRL Y-17796]
MSGDKASAHTARLSSEVDLFMHLMVLVYLMDQKDYQNANLVSEAAIARLKQSNKRTVDFIAAKLWFYISRLAELQGPEMLPALCSEQLTALRTATLRHDTESQASLITLLLRLYLQNHDIAMADNLVSKTSFPPQAGNALACRYLYYLSKIRAIQLDYSSAFEHVTGAIRKCPQSSHALGFLQAAHKLSIVIELLLGDIPDVSVFRRVEFERVLKPYFEVAQCVRVGDLEMFSKTVQAHKPTLIRDGTYTLILRLRQNVIKTGIRTMSLTYSKISLRDICIGLKLDNEASAEYMVARAIRDGVIEASLNHDEGYMQSKETLDVYITDAAQLAFHDRIQFCGALHDEYVKAMRYPMNEHKSELKSAQEALERERELANEIQDGDIDDEDDEDDADFDL